jgi:hypothetical protein
MADDDHPEYAAPIAAMSRGGVVCTYKVLNAGVA